MRDLDLRTGILLFELFLSSLLIFSWIDSLTDIDAQEEVRDPEAVLLQSLFVLSKCRIDSEISPFFLLVLFMN